MNLLSHSLQAHHLLGFMEANLLHASKAFYTSVMNVGRVSFDSAQPQRVPTYLDNCGWDYVRQHKRRVDRVAQVVRAVALSLGVREHGRSLGGAPVRGTVVGAFFHRREGSREVDSLSVRGLSCSARRGI